MSHRANDRAENSRDLPHPRARSIKGAQPLQANIRAVADIEQGALNRRTFADRFSDAVTHATGSAPFALAHLGWFTGWLVINTGHLFRFKPFDPYPFSFLTLVVSLEAIFLTVFVLMSQNRMARQADKRAHLDLQVDLLAEQELTLVLYLLRAICQKEGVPIEKVSERMRELLRETDVHKVATDLDARLPEI